MTKYFWVNHGQKFRVELENGFLWSPKLTRNGHRNQFYDNMQEANIGDVVLSYENKKIGHFGIVIEEASTAPKPNSHNSKHDWSNEGWRLPISWKIIPEIKPKLIWDEIGYLFPNKYSPLKTDGDGNQCYLAEITEQIFLTILQYALEKNPDLFSDLNSELIKESSALHRPTTEVERTVKQRVGQMLFRNEVMRLENKCPITDVSTHAFLRASHIKPWSACENAKERLDPYNGLALAPHIDHLFDKGYISFDTNGTLLLSDACPPNIPSMWNFESKIGESLIDVPATRRKYINYHNRVIFKK